MIEIPTEEKNFALTLQNNLQFYAQKCLKIKDKQGLLVPFVFNQPQEYIHAQIEDQKKKTGKVRVLILKGRQEGCSTYVEARYFHKASWKFGVAVGTLSHLADTTDKLYAIINRFYENLPGKLKPYLPINNSRNIKFAGIDSEWNLGTAGSDDVGRGGTIQLFHGSEVAYWPHPEKIRSGLMQSVSDLPGTEVILESTANGFDPFFYQLCVEAMNGVGDYKLIFVPWFWMPEYRKTVKDGFSLTEDEEKLKGIYNLEDDQLNWRRSKIIELGGVHEFRKEYPCNPTEAFQTSGDSFIPAEKVLQARKRSIDRSEYQHAPLIMGVDPSRTHDRTVISFRKGRKLLKVFVFDPRAKVSITRERLIVTPMDNLNDTIIAGLCSSFIKNFEPHFCNVDVGNGWGPVDLLHEQGLRKIVKPVLFHEAADDPLVYANKRAEILHRLMYWICGDDGDVDIPDEDMIQADFCCMPQPKPTSNSRILMAPKAEIIKKFGMSPDILESVALTFAFLINVTHHDGNGRIRKASPEKSGLKTLLKKRGLKSQEGFNPGNIFAR